MQTIRVDGARHLGLWEITHQYELDHAGHLSSGNRAGDQTTRRAQCPMRIRRSAPTPRTTAASPPVNTGRVARGAPHDNILTTSCTFSLNDSVGSFNAPAFFCRESRNPSALWSAIQTLSENTAWSHVEGQLDKKRGAFSQRLTKKLDEPNLRRR